MRASSPASSAADFADALAREDLGCAASVASIARFYASGSPQAADLLGQLSSHHDAAGASLVAAISASHVTASSSKVGANEGTSP